MPLFSVIIPTFNHADTIIWALKSVQEQSMQDFEVIVAGDGVPDRTRDIMKRFCAEDDRIRFIDNPKDAGKGETQRHNAVLASNGVYIAYLGDDDVWHSRHLEVMRSGMEETGADFCNSLNFVVDGAKEASILTGDIGKKFCRDTLLNLKFNFVGTSTVVHKRSSYHQLPRGWEPAPKGVWMDLHMWRQWFKEANMHFASIPQVTTVHLDSPGRDDMSVEDRAEESEYWLNIVRDQPVFADLEIQALRKSAMNSGCYRPVMHHFQHLYQKAQTELRA
ncbi:glycosyltransferase family 2 protein [Kordiimonas lacus]|nr:glycosyltransferase family 2 protein [Kordiimonas lacus]